MGIFRKSCIRAGRIVLRCMQCGVTGVKLWREYNDKNELYCSCCAQKATGYIAEIKPDGTHQGPKGQTNWIGPLIPAIPTEEETLFWGVAGIPEKLASKWESLPLIKGGPPGSNKRKPGELLDSIVQYNKLSKQKAKIEDKQEQLKEDVDEGLDRIGVERFESGGYTANWTTSTWTEYGQVVEAYNQLAEKFNLVHAPLVQAYNQLAQRYNILSSQAALYPQRVQLITTPLDPVTPLDLDQFKRSKPSLRITGPRK